MFSHYSEQSFGGSSVSWRLFCPVDFCLLLHSIPLVFQKFRVRSPVDLVAVLVFPVEMVVLSFQ